MIDLLIATKTIEIVLDKVIKPNNRTEFINFFLLTSTRSNPLGSRASYLLMRAADILY